MIFIINNFKEDRNKFTDHSEFQSKLICTSPLIKSPNIFLTWPEKNLRVVNYGKSQKSVNIATKSFIYFPINLSPSREFPKYTTIFTPDCLVVISDDPLNIPS